MNEFWEISLDLLGGFGVTCLIFAATLLFALPLGLLFAFGSMSRFRPLKYVVKVFVWIVRGTPLMLQILVIYYGPALLFGWGFLERINAVIVAFVINYACYFSEIYRGGIESISKGQYEAGQVLGMKKSQIFFSVILMQVVKRIIPPMSNEIITLVKDTSLAQTIGVVELMFRANEQLLDGAIWPIFYAGLFYLVFVGLLSLLFRYLEKKLSYYKV